MLAPRLIPVVLLASLFRLATAQPPTTDVQQSLKDGDAAFVRGDYNAASQSFAKAWEVVQPSAADNPLRYEVLKRLATTSAAQGQYSEARNYLQQAIEWREVNAGADDPKILDDLLLAINLDVRNKDFDAALAKAQRVQNRHIAASTGDSLVAADDYLRLGRIYLTAEKPREAISAFSQAAAVRIKIAGGLDPGLLPILDSLNDAFRVISGPRGAGDETYRQALVIREMLFGKDSSELISTVEGLADAYTAEGEYVAAEPVYLRLIALWESLVGTEHPMIALTLDKLVVLYQKSGDMDKAREALARSVAIRARFLALGLAHQAADAVAQGKREQARSLYNRALAAFVTPPRQEDKDLIDQIRKNLAEISRPVRPPSESGRGFGSKAFTPTQRK
jgi:tetratricopeptide (TPR) repeat protein